MEPPQEVRTGSEPGGWPGYQCAGPSYNREGQPRRHGGAEGHGEVLRGRATSGKYQLTCAPRQGGTFRPMKRAADGSPDLAAHGDGNVGPTFRPHKQRRNSLPEHPGNRTTLENDSWPPIFPLAFGRGPEQYSVVQIWPPAGTFASGRRWVSRPRCLDGGVWTTGFEPATLTLARSQMPPGYCPHGRLLGLLSILLSVECLDPTL